MIRNQPAGQPHDLDIAAGLALQPAARRNAVQVAVDEELEQHGGVITWPPGPRGGGAGEAQVRQIKLVDIKIDDADEAVFTDPVIQLIRESTDWPRSTPSMKPAILASA